MDVGPVGRVPARIQAGSVGLDALLFLETVGRAQAEQVGLMSLCLQIEFTKGRQIVQDVIPASIGGHHQIVKALLHFQPVNRCRGEVQAQAHPVGAVVGAHVDPVVDPQVQHPLSLGVFPDHVGKAVHRLWDGF